VEEARCRSVRSCTLNDGKGSELERYYLVCSAKRLLFVLVCLRYRPFNVGPITGTPFPSSMTGDRKALPLVSEHGR